MEMAEPDKKPGENPRKLWSEWATQGGKEGRMGSYCLTVTKFLFSVIKNFGNR